MKSENPSFQITQAFISLLFTHFILSFFLFLYFYSFFPYIFLFFYLFLYFLSFPFNIVLPSFLFLFFYLISFFLSLSVPSFCLNFLSFFLSFTVLSYFSPCFLSFNASLPSFLPYIFQYTPSLLSSFHPSLLCFLQLVPFISFNFNWFLSYFNDIWTFMKYLIPSHSWRRTVALLFNR